MDIKGSSPICPRDQRCAQWARIYMKYCLCSVKDGASFTLGLISVVSWGVAEVPQIITNYKEKSTESLSIAFLMTWIVGDLFNLFGCMLEPATLPTQFYMAMIYTATTLILAAQSIYYGHIYHKVKANKIGLVDKDSKHPQSVMVANTEQNSSKADDPKTQDQQISVSNVSVKGSHLPSSPIPVTATVLHCHCSAGQNLYYMSARSLSMSHTPTAGSYLAQPQEFSTTKSNLVLNQNSVKEPLLNSFVSAQSAPPLNTKSMLCAFAFTFFLSNFGLNLPPNNGYDVIVQKSNRGHVFHVGRKLLQSRSKPSFNLVQEGGGSSVGTFLGWAMAAIYMGGRLPQICLNIKRGSVEGLNPLMFFFALVGNATYVASILVSSLDWSKLRPNLPWLVDAGGCVVLDLFILVQFIYFSCRVHRSS